MSKRNLLALVVVTSAVLSLSPFSAKIWNAFCKCWGRDGTSETLPYDFPNSIETPDQIILNVLDFGAKGGNRDDTEAVRRALRFASSISNTERTTTILFPQNRVFSTGPLNLTSGITLQVDGTLRALYWNETNWPQIPPLVNYGNSDDSGFYLQYQSFLYANNADNIRITGTGIIDGRGQAWWDAFRNHEYLTAGRPNLVQFVNSKNIEIAGVTLQDSPFWCVHPVLCTDVHIHHVKIRSHMYAENSDGIDPDMHSHRHSLTNTRSSNLSINTLEE